LFATYHIPTEPTIKRISLQIDTVIQTRRLPRRTLTFTLLLSADFECRAADLAVDDVCEGVS
jgi:hypothetical protein